MFVFYLDDCNTALWKAFFVSLIGVALLCCGLTALRLITMRGDRRALEVAGITGSTLEKLKPRPVKRLSFLFLLDLTSVCSFYVSYCGDFVCSPGSMFRVDRS